MILGVFFVLFIFSGDKTRHSDKDTLPKHPASGFLSTNAMAASFSAANGLHRQTPRVSLERWVWQLATTQARLVSLQS